MLQVVKFPSGITSHSVKEGGGVKTMKMFFENKTKDIEKVQLEFNSILSGF